jgi:hypothetical protein
MRSQGLEAAYHTLRRAYDLRSQTLGTADPSCAVLTNNSAATAVQLDDLAVGGRRFSDSYDVKTRMLGLLSPEALTAMLGLQSLFLRQEDKANLAPFARGAGVVQQALHKVGLDFDAEDLSLPTLAAQAKAKELRGTLRRGIKQVKAVVHVQKAGKLHEEQPPPLERSTPE